MCLWKVHLAAIAIVAMFSTAAVRAADAPKAETAASKPAPAADHSSNAKRSEFWLGLIVSPPSPALQAQLDLPKDQGLLVHAVQPKSPAAKAGVRQFDILLKGNEKPLAEIGDLVKLIDQVKEGKLTLELLRAGKRETVAATLTKRPAGAANECLSRDAREWLLKIDPHTTMGQPLQFHLIRPGQILPPGGPAAVSGAVSPDVQGDVLYLAGPGVPAGLPGTIAIRSGPDVEKRMGNLQNQIDELRKTVEALQARVKKAESKTK